MVTVTMRYSAYSSLYQEMEKSLEAVIKLNIEDPAALSGELSLFISAISARAQIE